MEASEEGTPVGELDDVSGVSDTGDDTEETVVDESSVEGSGPDELSDGSNTEVVGKVDDGILVVLANLGVACDRPDEEEDSTEGVEGKSEIGVIL